MAEPGRHEVLLAATDTHTRSVVADRLRAAQRQRHHVVTVAAPVGPELTGAPGAVTALPAEQLREPAVARELVDRAFDRGFDGLSVLVWADDLVAETSSAVHAALEAELERLCRVWAVSALCVYDRGLYDRAATGTSRLSAAVERHPDGLHEDHLVVRRDGHRLAVRGEVDMSNVDVLDAALMRFLHTTTGPVLVDLTGVAFLSVDAVRVLVSASGERGGGVEIVVGSSHLSRMLGLLGTLREGTTVRLHPAP